MPLQYNLMNFYCYTPKLGFEHYILQECHLNSLTTTFISLNSLRDWLVKPDSQFNSQSMCNVVIENMMYHKHKRITLEAPKVSFHQSCDSLKVKKSLR